MTLEIAAKFIAAAIAIAQVCKPVYSGFRYALLQSAVFSLQSPVCSLLNVKCRTS